MEQISIFETLGAGERERLSRAKSTDWKWNIRDGYPKEKNGLTVLSCFAGGGGSTMGYKLAGCDVLGCVEIDRQMNAVYIKNHAPKFNYLMDLRDFNSISDSELPSQLFDLDILDGSPPCTTFSAAGEREKNWGKKKKFREGQVEQTLDDLSFVFIETVKKLKPKTVIMENVEGLLMGEAWKYVQRIYADFSAAGYAVNHWLLKGETMGVPQKRHRVIFVAIRKDLEIDPLCLNMTFDYEPVLFREIRSEHGKKPTKGDAYLKLMEHRIESDHCIADISVRVKNKYSGFTNRIMHDEEVCGTITSKGMVFRYCDGLTVTKEDIIHAQTFPEDYSFDGIAPQYVCGMSVPPVMIKRVVERLVSQGVYDYKKNGGRE